jgi:hypothetical protein
VTCESGVTSIPNCSIISITCAPIVCDIAHSKLIILKVYNPRVGTRVTVKSNLINIRYIVTAKVIKIHM